MFSDILARCKDEKKLVGVYTDRQDATKFDVGTVIAMDGDFFLLSSVSKYGRRNGFVLCAIDSVVRVDEDNIYLKKIAALMRYYNERPEPFSVDQYLVYSLLEHCRANSRIASVELMESGGSDVVGFVDELDIDRCVVRQISEYGKSDGLSNILLQDVTSVCCGSETETMLEVLSSEMFDEVRFS